MLRKFNLCFLILIFCLPGHAQTEGVFATSSVKSFTVNDLSSEMQELWKNRDASVKTARKQLLSQLIADKLIELEAASKNTEADKLLAAEKAKIADPTDAQIKTVYDANRDALKDHSEADARKQIIRFLRHEAEEAALKTFASSLAAKYKVVNGRDINSPDLKPSDVIVTVNGKPATGSDFEEKYRLILFDQRAEIYDKLADELDPVIYSALVAAEAKSQNLDPSSLLAKEITNKLREYSDEERLGLERDFRARLYTKYNVKVMLEPPASIVQNISVDDDPFQGPATAPVTVVMFSDFQCPACAATHPALKNVIAGYKGRVRFVVRDFPLTSIHDNALMAAKAAAAAHAQGKFFEYIELLYSRQDALDADSLRKYAAEINLNAKQFEIDLASDKTAAEISKDVADGRLYGVSGTPTIFVNGIKVRRLSADAIRAAIDAALKK